MVNHNSSGEEIFKTPEEETREELIKQGGIFYEEIKDPETQEIKKYVNILGIRVETYTTKEDIEKLVKGSEKEKIQPLILSELDQQMMRKIAETYSLNQALLFEGDPGLGKTFLSKKFTKLIHGSEAPILLLQGTPRTSELDILGHWAPKGLTEAENEKFKETLKQYSETGDLKVLRADLDAKIISLSERLKQKTIDQPLFQSEFGNLVQDYENKSKEAMLKMAQLLGETRNNVEWEFKEGPLIKMYKGISWKNKNGETIKRDGYPLIVDEFDLIPSNYQQIFLTIGGEKGQLSNEIYFHGNTGQTIFPRGKDASIAFTSNFPEKTPGRATVVGPMTDRVVWSVVDSQLAQQKEEAIIDYTMSSGREKPKLEEIYTTPPAENTIDFRNPKNEKIAKILATVIKMFKNQFDLYYRQVGDYLGEGTSKIPREQRMETSVRNSLRVIDYLSKFQYKDPKTGIIDFSESLKRAMKLYYIDRLVDKDARDKIELVLDDILGGVTGPRIDYLGKQLTIKETLQKMTENLQLSPEELKRRKEETEAAEFAAMATDIDKAKKDLIGKIKDPDILKALENI